MRQFLGIEFFSGPIDAFSYMTSDRVLRKSLTFKLPHVEKVQSYNHTEHVGLSFPACMVSETLKPGLPYSA